MLSAHLQPFPPAREISSCSASDGPSPQFCFYQVFRLAQTALSNGLTSLRSQTVSLHCSRFVCIRSADRRGAAEDGQASGGMIKREFSMRSWRAGGHFFNLTTAAATDVRDVVEVGIAGVDVRLAQRTTPSFLPSRTRRHLRSPTIVERMDHIRRRPTACELAERRRL